MNKEFIPYEQALELKELGFNESCFGRFYTKPKCKMFGIDEKGRTYPIKNTPKKLYTIGECCVLNEDNVITAPTFSQAFRWFREENKLHAVVDINISDEWYFSIFNLNSKRNAEVEVLTKDEYYNTYEESELACLKKLIEFLKQQKG
jgi:hypothetical protein